MLAEKKGLLDPDLVEEYVQSVPCKEQPKWSTIQQSKIYHSNILFRFIKK